MASSPPAPFPASLPNPKKRSSISSQVSSGPLNKRPKLHPLRQTSFPANSEAAAAAAAYASATSARSETASVAPSTFSTTSTARPAPRGRGRPRKSLQVTDEGTQPVRENNTRSTGAGGRNTTSKSVISAAARSGANAGGGDDEDDEDEEDEVHDHDDEEDDNENEKDNAQREADRLNAFLGQLSDAQMNRYQNYRSSSLKTSVIRRIVNQTVSQSVGKTQIDAVQFFSKAFAIEIIEGSREIQEEWAVVRDGEVKREKDLRRQKVKEKEEELERKQKELEVKQKEQREREEKMRELTEAAAAVASAASAVTTTVEPPVGSDVKEENKKGEASAADAGTGTATTEADIKSPPPSITQPQPQTSQLDLVREDFRATLQTLSALRSELTKLRTEIPKLKADAERYIPNKHRGGLLPDHLREAVRRYKADGEGGGFGFDGVSHPLLGVTGAIAWRLGDGNVGQRLFR